VEAREEYGDDDKEGGQGGVGRRWVGDRSVRVGEGKVRRGLHLSA
jgi:hypothetical protein